MPTIPGRFTTLPPDGQLTYQPIPQFAGAAPDDDDSYGVDARDAMAFRGDTIASVELGAVFRTDGQPMAEGDLTASDAALIPEGTALVVDGNAVTAGAGLFYAWSAVGGMVGITYGVTIVLTLAGGAILNRTTLIQTPSYVG